MATNVPITTIGTYLMHGVVAQGATEPTYTKLIDIKSVPDIGGSPDTLETTTMSDSERKFILGLQSSDSMDFTANYCYSDYDTVKRLDDGNEKFLAIWFGKDSSGNALGQYGRFTFKGYVSVHLNGAGVNEVPEMTISIAKSSAVTVTVGSE